MLQVTTDTDTLHLRPAEALHACSMLYEWFPTPDPVDDFSLVELEGYLPYFRPITNPANVFMYSDTTLKRIE